MSLPEGERLGILGGTFDPPHYGHLALASEAAYRFHLDRMVLVPARRPPHKSRGPVAGFEHRLRMTSLAIGENAMLEVRDLEGADASGYSVDLLASLHRSSSTTYFVIGMDSLLELGAWKDPGRLLSLARVVAGSRPGYHPSRMPELARGRVEVFATPGLWISSSELRERFAEGAPTAYLTPEKVRSYILEEGLYVTGS